MPEAITNNFKCLDLTQDDARIISLEKCLCGIKTGFHAFYTHEGLITGVKHEIDGSPETLEHVFKVHKFSRKLVIKDDIRFELYNDSLTHPLVLMTTTSTSRPEDITTFFQALREMLNSNSSFKNLKSNDGSSDHLKTELNFRESPGCSLNQSACWDLCLEREKYSGLIPGINDYHEYLLWDDGGCLNKDTLHDLDVWHGAGWMNSRLRDLSQQSSDQWQLDHLGIWFNSANEQLSHALTNLTTFYNQQKIEPHNLESHNNFIRALCEFLPYHRSLRNNKDIPSNSLGERGGPIPWRGLLDDRMYLRRRHLLMDGWLTLWPYQENGATTLYVQPGSLALLYWAAHKMDMPHTETPEDFLDNYDWSDKHWFGGKWSRINAS